MEIGKKIKALRADMGMTQDKLAQTVGVTPQAVSKWENGTALPDISLLPALSVCFGVRIDDFFELSDDNKLERIENMVEQERFLSREDFDYVQRFYKERISADPKDAESIRGLAHLYNHRAMGYYDKAETLAKRALELEPCDKAGHSLLDKAAGGAGWDWCSSNHRQLIDFYYDFIEKNPDYARGYLWLMDNLIADGRLDEAEKIALRMGEVEYDWRVPLYLGHIYDRRGDKEKSEEYWREMCVKWPDDWLVWSSMGDVRAKQCRYEEAIEYFKKAAEMEPAPRFIDNWDSIAQLNELLERWGDAAEAYEKVLAIYRDDWQIVEGHYVDHVKTTILRCRAKM